MPVSTNPLVMYNWRKEHHEVLLPETLQSENNIEKDAGEGIMEDTSKEGCDAPTYLQEMVLQEEKVNKSTFVPKVHEIYGGMEC